MIPSVLLSQSDKLYAGLASVGTLVGGTWFVAAIESGSLINGIGAGSCIAICASVFTAFFRNRPGTIKALAEAKAAEAATLEKATSALISRITEANDKQVAQLTHDLEYARSRAELAEQIQQQERMGKHAAVEQLHSIVLHARILDEVLREPHLQEVIRERNIEVPPMLKVDFGRVFGAADNKTAALLDDRSTTGKKATMRIDIPVLVSPPGPVRRRPAAPPAPVRPNPAPSDQ